MVSSICKIIQLEENVTYVSSSRHRRPKQVYNTFLNPGVLSWEITASTTHITTLDNEKYSILVNVVFIDVLFSK